MKEKRARKKEGCVVADKASRRGAGVVCRLVTCWGSVKKGQAARSLTLNPDDAVCIIQIHTYRYTYIYICDICII